MEYLKQVVAFRKDSINHIAGIITYVDINLRWCCEAIEQYSLQNDCDHFAQVVNRESFDVLAVGVEITSDMSEKRKIGIYIGGSFSFENLQKRLASGKTEAQSFCISVEFEYCFPPQTV